MYFWMLWGIGWIFVVLTRILLNTVCADGKELDRKPLAIRSVIQFFMIICIVLVGGIANGLLLGICCLSGVIERTAEVMIIVSLSCGIIPAALTYFVGYIALGLYHVRSKFMHMVFVVVFVLSIVCWTIPIDRHYNNVVTETRTSVTSTVDKELIYFCGISTQVISEHGMKSSANGSSFIKEIEGESTAFDELPYWYMNENGEVLYDSADAYNSRLVFLMEEETPYVRIITHTTQKVQKDNNTGKEIVIEESSWREYEFNLPAEIMRYNIN